MQILKMKRVLACLLAAVLALPLTGVAVSADEEGTAASDTAVEEGAETGAEETIEIEEEVEEFDVTLEEVTTHMQLVGTCDDYEVYLRSEDYKDEIEAAFLAKVGSTYADEDEAEDAADEVIKHLKDAEIALLDPATNTVLAVFEELGKTEESLVYMSGAGRYLVFLNKEQNKVQKIRYRVSTLDSEYLFLTKDKETLELYSADYEEVLAEMTMDESDKEQCIYRSADQLFWAVLSADKTQAWACVKQVAENDKMIMYVDPVTAVIALENKANGYIWWSTPLNANRDKRATNTLANELQSSLVLTYANTENRSLTNQRSRNAAEVDIDEQDDGVKITYKFDKSGISVPVTYTLCEDYMEVSLDCSKIKEKEGSGLIATQVTMLGSFGAGTADEEGYFVLPDGCGALVHFNNGKEKAKTYSQPVYGRDITVVPTTKPAVTEKIYLPVYGIVKDGNAMAVVIEEGDGNAFLNASVSGQSLSSFNVCNFSFRLRGSDSVAMPGDAGSLTMFEGGEIKTEKITTRYYPLEGEDLDYVDVAETYRNYLLEDGGVEKKAAADSTEMFLDLYGGTMKSRSILGIPITLKTSMTSYSEAQEIVSGLVSLGVDDMVVVYNNWTNEGISGKVDNKAKPSGTLGGAGDFNDLKDYLAKQGIAFYPSVNNLTFNNGNGYYTFTDTTIRISGSYSRQMTYNLSYGVQDTSVTTKSLLSPGNFTKIYSKLASNYSKRGLTGVSLGSMTSTLYGDYGKVAMSRDDTMAAMEESYKTMEDAGLDLLADSCAAYALPYADRISDVPLQSSGFDVFDEDIPFYQIVMHGVIPYSGTAINASADGTWAFLSSIATGCNPAYDMIYAEASDLKDTDLDTYFYSNYGFWSNTAAEEYQIAKEVLASVSDQTITAYSKTDDVATTVYENGTEVVVDFAEETITVNGTVIDLDAETKGE